MHQFQFRPIPVPGIGRNWLELEIGIGRNWLELELVGIGLELVWNWSELAWNWSGIGRNWSESVGIGLELARLGQNWLILTIIYK
jgi:hypothetical protein